MKARKDAYIGRITSKGQTTIPKEVRDFLGLSEGAQVEWSMDDGKAIVRPRTLRAVELAGILGKPPNGRHATLGEMDEALGQAAIERLDRATRS